MSSQDNLVALLCVIMTNYLGGFEVVTGCV